MDPLVISGGGSKDALDPPVADTMVFPLVRLYTYTLVDSTLPTSISFA